MRAPAEAGRARRGDRGAAALRASSAASALILAGSVGYAATYGCGAGAAEVSAGGVSNASYVEQSIAPHRDGNQAVIDAYGENGNFGTEVRIPIDIPSDLLPVYQEAAEAYGVPFEIIAAIGAKETHHGRFLAHGDGSPSGVQEGTRNAWGAAGIMQMGVADPDDPSDLAGGAASNGWGGRPIERVEDRAHTYEVGEVPSDPSVFGTSHFGIDGNGDGIVNAWDPWDNIMSATFKLAYIERRAEADYGSSPSDSCANASPAVTDPLDCAIYRHNLAHWYVEQVKAIASVYAEDGSWETAPALNIRTASNVSNAATGRECEPGATPAGMPWLPPGLGDHQEAVLTYSREQLGKPYVWGATGPDSFDCSGLTMQAYAAAGITIPRVTTGQFDPDHGGWSVPARKFQTDGLVIEELQPGDLLFYDNGSSIYPGHVTLYLGNGEMIHAPNPSTPVSIVSVAEYPLTFVGAVRVYPEATQA
ncbi:C40 family peptidase [Nocardiopsis potens]|uniref:C40 family peptidase n=1 Tax=Nocardiopsis potens TaxID=1246458 RepID=UPI0003467763|nr:C40 family peptidase [Nocardiopsis potens]